MLRHTIYTPCFQRYQHMSYTFRTHLMLWFLELILSYPGVNSQKYNGQSQHIIQIYTHKHVSMQQNANNTTPTRNSHNLSHSLYLKIHYLRYCTHIKKLIIAVITSNCCNTCSKAKKYLHCSMQHYVCGGWDKSFNFFTYHLDISIR